MTDLSHRAMLAILHQRAWKATATDREVASHAEAAYEAESGTMRVIKELTPKSYIQPIQQIMGLGRHEHYRMTVPGFSRGQHLLATAMFDRYAMIQSEIKEQFYRAVDNFLTIYPEILEEAPVRLANAFREEDFPTEAQIKSYFEYRVRFAPIPSTNDWRLEGVTDRDTAKLRGEIEDEVRAMFNAATKEVYERAHGVLVSIANQAKTYVPGPGAAQLRDATIANLKEVSELVVKMNITKDPLLDQIGNEMLTEFAHLQGAELRKSAELRDSVASAATRMLAKMAAVKTTKMEEA